MRQQNFKRQGDLKLRTFRPTPNHRRNGNTIAEMPLALWFIFLGFGFPLLVLGSLGIRFGLFWEAAREAADHACIAQTFQFVPDDGTGLYTNAQSAVQAATTQAQSVLSTFPGCATLIQPPEIYIGSTQIGTTTTNWLVSTPNTKLNPSQLQTDTYVYSIKVILTGQVNPLITLNLPLLGSIPGLTKGFPTTVSEERIFENPNGLSQ